MARSPERDAMVRRKILIVEDEPDIRELLEYELEREGYDVLGCADGTVAVSEARRHAPDLILLDLMLPGIDGIEVCRQLKRDDATRGIGVVMLTAKTEEADVILGLGLGADDYVGKPFSAKEVVARVKAVLRRSGGQEQVDADRGTLVRGLLRVDPIRHKVTLGVDEVPLTATEFKILRYLASRPGRVFSRQQILEAAIGPSPMVLDRNADVHIRSIRKKLGDHRDLIETVRGVGYRFAEVVET